MSQDHGKRQLAGQQSHGKTKQDPCAQVAQGRQYEYVVIPQCSWLPKVAVWQETARRKFCI